MNPRRGITAFLLLAVAFAPAVGAWAPETRVGMIDDAIKLMPRSLRLALETHRQDVLRGALKPMIDEDGPEHRAPSADGSLDRQIEGEATALAALLGRQSEFDAVSEQFGRLGHFVMDAAFPPGVSEDDGDSRYDHFAEFCEQRREKFRLVFYGHDDEQLAVGDFHAFALEVIRRASSEDRELARAYSAAGDPPDPSAFDDRSIPFAVGALAYSRAVNDIVRAWLTVWRQVGGDLGRTPYLDNEPRRGDLSQSQPGGS
ncbi:MAG TPA: hypothetical protein VD788_08095 [Candidatus Polarisedimenticolaceae bacterium]|nr:hypothetical protein [Candidatus Polarisedimenticolaceae bacterium]